MGHTHFAPLNTPFPPHDNDTYNSPRRSAFDAYDARITGPVILSDVDLLVEFSRPVGLFEFVRLQRELGERLGRRVEVVTPAALKPQLRDRILDEAVVAA